jgi:hypothetical protein
MRDHRDEQHGGQQQEELDSFQHDPSRVVGQTGASTPKAAAYPRLGAKN